MRNLIGVCGPVVNGRPTTIDTVSGSIIKKPSGGILPKAVVDQVRFRSPEPPFEGPQEFVSCVSRGRMANLVAISRAILRPRLKIEVIGLEVFR